MGELNFTPAGRVDPSAFAGAKVLLYTTVGGITTNGKTVELNDDLLNYDVVFFCFYGTSRVNVTVRGNYIGTARSSNGGAICIKIAGGSWFAIYTGANSTFSDQVSTEGFGTFSGKEIVLTAQSSGTASVSLRVFGLKIGAS